jgi:hypothetical protein
VEIGDSSPNFDISDDLIYVFMRFLHSSGLLIRNNNRLMIPNDEIKLHLSQELVLNGFIKAYNFSHKHSKSVSDVLHKMMYCGDTNFVSLKNTLEAYLRDTHNDLRQISRNERHLHHLVESSTYLLPYWFRINSDSRLAFLTNVVVCRCSLANIFID